MIASFANTLDRMPEGSTFFIFAVILKVRKLSTPSLALKSSFFALREGLQCLRKGFTGPGFSTCGSLRFSSFVPKYGFPHDQGPSERRTCGFVFTLFAFTLASKAIPVSPESECSGFCFVRIHYLLGHSRIAVELKVVSPFIYFHASITPNLVSSIADVSVDEGSVRCF